MKFFVCILTFLVFSGLAFGKEKKILIGAGIWISPEIGYDSIRTTEDIVGTKEEHRTTMGVSAEFVAPQPDGNFFGLGMDAFFKSSNKENLSTKVAPISLFANFGIMEPYCVNLNVRVFGGIGATFLNYRTLHHESEFENSLGLSYQVGAGIITKKIFVDVLMRGADGSLERTFEGIESKTESDYSFTSAMLKVGLVF